MKIMFICKHNRFRSRVAFGYFNKINKNKKIKSYSAGIFKGIPVNPVTIGIAEENEINIKGKTNCIDEKLLDSLDMLVIVANDIPKSLFNGKFPEIRVWKIPDCKQIDRKRIREIIRMIMRKVDALVKELEDKK